MPRSPDVRRFRRLTIALAVLALAAGSLACSDDGDDPTGTDATNTTVAGSNGTASDTTVASSDTTPVPTEPAISVPSTPPETEPEPEPDLGALNDAYVQGYTETCQSVFALSSSGTMADPEDPETTYVLEECTDAVDPTGGEFYDTPAEAFDAGAEEALITLESFTMSGVLCSPSGQCWSA